MNISFDPLVFLSLKYEFTGKVKELKTPGSVLNPSNGQKVNGMFLWDTGATTSCVNSQIASKIGLNCKGLIELCTANGLVKANTYIVSIILKETYEKGATTFEKKQLVTAVNLSPNNILGLIGMDIIGLGSFLIHYNNATGKHTLQFSFPSLEKLNHFSFKNEASKQNKKSINKTSGS